MCKFNNKIGFKIYQDNLSEDVLHNLKHLLSERYIIEFSQFEDFPKKTIDFLNLKSYTNNFYHVNYNKVDISRYFKIKSSKDVIIENLIEEFKNSDLVNCNNLVFHVENENPFFVVNDKQKIFYFNKIFEFFSTFYEKYPEATQKVFYIENTFNSSLFYKDLILFLKENNINVGFCFDIGHAKVWSSDSFDTWYSDILYLIKFGIPIHSHIHANKGDFDTHSPLAELDSNAFFNKRITDDFIFSNNLLKDIEKLINNKNISVIFEYNINIAIMDFILFFK